MQERGGGPELKKEPPIDPRLQADINVEAGARQAMFDKEQAEAIAKQIQQALPYGEQPKRSPLPASERQEKLRQIGKLKKKKAPAASITALEDEISAGLETLSTTPLDVVKKSSPQFKREWEELWESFAARRKAIVEGRLKELGQQLLAPRSDFGKDVKAVFEGIGENPDIWKITKHGTATLVIGALTIAAPAIGLPAAWVFWYHADLDWNEFRARWKKERKARKERREKIGEALDQVVWLEDITHAQARDRLVGNRPAFIREPDGKLVTNLGIELASDPDNPEVEKDLAKYAEASAPEPVKPNAAELDKRLRRLILSIARAKGVKLIDTSYDRYRAMNPADQRRCVLAYLETVKAGRFDEKEDKARAGQRLVDPSRGPRYDLTVIAKRLWKAIS